MPIIFSGARGLGGGAVTQVDPYAATFLNGWNNGMQLGASSVQHGIQVGEQRRQDEQRRAEWDRQYGLQRDQIDYNRQQDQQSRQAAALANTPILQSIMGRYGMGEQQAPGGVGPPVPGAPPDLSALDPQAQAAIVNRYQQEAMMKVQQQRDQAIQQGLQEMAPATMELVAGMPDTSPFKSVYAQQLAIIGQVAQDNPGVALDMFQRVQQAAASEIGKVQARQEAVPGVKEYLLQFPITQAERNAVVAMVATGAIKPEDSGDQVKRILESKRQEALTPQDWQGIFPQLSAERAAVLAKAEAAGKHLDLPEVSITGQPKAQPVSPEQIRLDREVMQAEGALKDAEEASKAAFAAAKENPENRDAWLEVQKTQIALRNARQNHIEAVQTAKGANGGTSAAVGAVRGGTSGTPGGTGGDQGARVRAVQQAWSELGPNADPSKVAERARQLLGQ